MLKYQFDDFVPKPVQVIKLYRVLMNYVKNWVNLSKEKVKEKEHRFDTNSYEVRKGDAKDLLVQLKELKPTNWEK